MDQVRTWSQELKLITTVFTINPHPESIIGSLHTLLRNMWIIDKWEKGRFVDVIAEVDRSVWLMTMK